MSVELGLNGEDATAAGKTVYVYEAPVRLWHWLNALCITVLAVTGYFIASPLPSVSGEASEHFLMGYIRFTHFAAAYIFAFGFLGRVYWAFAGNHHAKQLFLLPLTDKEWWRGLRHEIRWYSFLEKQPKKYVGHNPLAHLLMFISITLGSVFMIITGFAMYGEGAQEGHWTHTLFTSWVIPLFGQSQAVHSWHHLVAWGIVTFVIVHVYAAVREDMLSRQTMISTIIGGSRTFR
ncbi:MAG: Ni/Fe-hydrogenase, b-type cytochrome subunit [Burkholderiales bacterium]